MKLKTNKIKDKIEKTISHKLGLKDKIENNKFFIKRPRIKIKNKKNKD